MLASMSHVELSYMFSCLFALNLCQGSSPHYDLFVLILREELTNKLFLSNCGYIQILDAVTFLHLHSVMGPSSGNHIYNVYKHFKHKTPCFQTIPSAPHVELNNMCIYVCTYESPLCNSYTT